MEAIQEAVISSAVVIITTLIGVITKNVTEWLRSKINTDKLWKQKDLIQSAVRAVEQEYQDTDGPRKYQLAKERALQSLNEYGLDITPDQLNNFIEEAVGAFNEGLKSGLSAAPSEAHIEYAPRKPISEEELMDEQYIERGE